MHSHIKFIKNLQNEFFADNSKEFTAVATRHFKCNALYWGLMTSKLLYIELDSKVVSFVQKCYNNGGFGPDLKAPNHIVSTLSCVQILSTFDKLFNVEEIANYILGLIQDDGSFRGSYALEETDSRFIYCGLLTLYLLDFDFNNLDMKKIMEYLCSCQNNDGGFGIIPGTESHAGQTYCCIGAVMLLSKKSGIDYFRYIKKKSLLEWLKKLQCPSGGFSGRLEKLEDVCYSWWVIASIKMMGLDPNLVIDGSKLKKYNNNCSSSNGGFSDRPGNAPDLYHTFFSLASLAILDKKEFEKEKTLGFDHIHQ